MDEQENDLAPQTTPVRGDTGRADSELLELAAKAAGISRSYYEYLGQCGLINDDGDGGFWNPLTDDGDALRLAVKLEINVMPCMDQASARNPSYTGFMNEYCGADPYAATRRAIVRAAAEIGRGL